VKVTNTRKEGNFRHPSFLRSSSDENLFSLNKEATEGEDGRKAGRRKHFTGLKPAVPPLALWRVRRWYYDRENPEGPFISPQNPEMQQQAGKKNAEQKVVCNCGSTFAQADFQNCPFCQTPITRLLHQLQENSPIDALEIEMQQRGHLKLGEKLKGLVMSKPK